MNLKDSLLAYVGLCMSPTTQTVACAHRHTTVQRLALWLLASCKLMEAQPLFRRLSKRWRRWSA
ncbi:hypothetical protein [Paucibacter sp. XJ19-41]|uniref:hypothetical protein n=1 Tax=Paucibacter sp. XJ19-41 TaxID=2927824 RepID=UPI00234A28E1|nr:hypothetical protein [Paucibacter sp. XJ19-41]MDC6169383.1 hypothetical protein [Paucibacter sp. XJ19-41]